MVIRVLLASPKQYERKLIKGYFSRLGYEEFIKDVKIIPEELDRGDEAITLLKKSHEADHDIDLVISSDRLLDLSGLALAEAIQDSQISPKPPCILYAPNVTIAFATKAKNAGVREIIVLPLKLENFHIALTKIVDEAVAEQEILRKEKLVENFENQSNVEMEQRLAMIYSESMSALNKVQKLAPWSHKAQLSMAKIYCGKNDFESALPILKKLIDSDFRDKMAHELLMLCYKRLGKSYEDTTDLKLMVQQNPTSSPLNLRLGEIILREGSYDEAIRLFRRAIDTYKKSEAGRILEKSGGENDERANGSAPDPNRSDYSGIVSAYFNLITAYKKKGDSSMALEALKEVSKISPEAPEDWLSVFQTYLSYGDFSKARYSINKALELNKNNEEFLNIAAEAYVRQGKYDEALSFFERLSKLTNSDAKVYNFIGICNRRTGSHSAALDAYSKALKLTPDDSSIHFNKGSVLEDQNRPDDALLSYKEALRLNPDFQLAKNAIERLAKKKGSN